VHEIVIERITAAKVLLFKEVRLRALQDAPHAFGSTYAKETEFAEAEWMRRAERWNGESGIGFLAMEESTPRGISGALLDEKDATRARLVSMWTAPTHRQRGIGRLLVNEVHAWARVPCS
jgi:GNAT superfamily N-acetyltransferase